MKQKRHKPEEVIRLLREHDASGLTQEDFCRQKQISVATLNRWRKKYGQMDEADAKRLKALEKENAELKKMYAEAMLGNKILKEALEKSCERGASPGSGASDRGPREVRSAAGVPVLRFESLDVSLPAPCSKADPAAGGAGCCGSQPGAS